MKILYAAATAAVLMLAAGPSLARTMPNHDCPGQNRSCIADCDQADQHKINAIYSKCLKACAEAMSQCTDRQNYTNDCAAEFSTCISQPDNDKENCRAVYRYCKDHYTPGGH